MKWYVWALIVIVGLVIINSYWKRLVFERGVGFEGKWTRGNPFLNSPGAGQSE